MQWLQSAAVTATTLASLVLLCAVLAYWTWAWLAPRPAPVAPAGETLSRPDAAYNLFGGARRSRNATAVPGGPSIRLLGVAAAAGGKSGHAIVQLDGGRTLVAREGAEIAPGLRLVEVQSGQIILERNGLRETLALPEKK
jgi:general secretion pathway protein C